jgi:hypothetical protein
VDEQEGLVPALLGVAEQHPTPDVVVPLTAGELGEQLGRLVGVEQPGQVLAQDLLLVEAEQGADAWADVADRPVGRHGEDHIADLSQRLVELDPSDHRAGAGGDVTGHAPVRMVPISRAKVPVIGMAGRCA